MSDLAKLKIKKFQSQRSNYDAGKLFRGLRKRFPGSLLLDSYHVPTGKHTNSIICSNPILQMEVHRHKDHYQLTVIGQGQLACDQPLLTQSFSRDSKEILFPKIFKAVQSLFTCDLSEIRLFGFCAYEALELCDTLRLKTPKDPDLLLRYQLFSGVLDQRGKKLNYCCTSLGQSPTLDELLSLAETEVPKCSANGLETSILSEADHAECVKRARPFLQRGDVFQVVLSRKTRLKIEGDCLALYERLKSINPSPFHFFFDYPDFRLGGASPELHLLVGSRFARIDPIAGTYRRSGKPEEDAKQELELINDPKERSEHMMLVDLARNDLSRFCREVRVRRMAELQRFSHVSHLVSQVQGKITNPDQKLALFSSSFPAGTLTGAPKYRAMQIIDEIEPETRGFYGGAIGYFYMDGRSMHAITIRSFSETGGMLSLQSGGGIVFDSIPESEVLEAKAKIRAVKSCLN